MQECKDFGYNMIMFKRLQRVWNTILARARLQRVRSINLNWRASLTRDNLTRMRSHLNIHLCPEALLPEKVIDNGITFSFSTD
jgi:hypothetical protein